MPEPDLALIGRNLRDIQIEQRVFRSRLDRIDARLDRLEERLDTVDARLDQVLNRIDSFEKFVEAKLDQQTILIDRRFHQLSELIKYKGINSVD